MLTLETIKKLSEYTDSTKVLKTALELSESNIPYVIRLYNLLGEESLNIKASHADALVESYIKQRLIDDKIAIERLVESEEFRKKIAELTEEELEKYIELCDKDAFNDLLTNKNIIANYSATDHFALMELGKDLRIKSTLVKDTFFFSIANSYSVDVIKQLMKAVENYTTPNNINEMTALLENENFYKTYQGTEAVNIIAGLYSISDTKILNILIKIIIAGYWKDHLKFEQIRDLASFASETNQILLEKEIIYQDSYEDIAETLNITQENTHLIPLFSHKVIRDNLSYEQIISLISEFNLEETENFDNFATVLSTCLQRANLNDLYEDLRSGLYKEEYETTVMEYLKNCHSIKQFIKGLEPTLKDNDPVDPNGTLILKKI